LFVGHEGTALDHHFLLPADGTSFDFVPGDYTIRVFAKLVKERKPTLLGTFSVRLTEASAREALITGSGVFFDWGPDLGRYHAHSRPILPTPATDKDLR